MEQSPGSLRNSDFEAIARLVHETCGISLRDGKQELVKARLMKRMRELAISDFAVYLERVKTDHTGAELDRMLDLLTTNKTSFFRESQHFDLLRTAVIPELPGRRIRVWSAACSSGEEPYTIAMTLRACLPSPDSFDARILATDISTRVLAKARAATYEAETLASLPPGYAGRFFTGVDAGGRRLYRVVDEVRRLVSLARLNLLEAWPMKGPFDAVFCRNAMIYFDKPTQEALVNRYWSLLRPGGWLFVGHSESLAGMKHPFEYIQPAAYRKEAD